MWYRTKSGKKFYVAEKPQAQKTKGGKTQIYKKYNQHNFVQN